MGDNTLKIFEKDPWLRSHEGEMRARWDRYQARQREITQVAGSLADFANAHRFYGFHRDEEAGGWWFREWLPGAEQVFLFGDFNGWNRHQLPLGKGKNGLWSIFLADGHYALLHGMRIKMLVVGPNGSHERIPAYIRRVVQDEATKDFCGQLWMPAAPFDWQDDAFDPRSIGTPFIYEAHVGMAQEAEGVGTYTEFSEKILPRIKAQGYNAVQLMAVAEHPYYGSFGYHVSNFYAPSSRFGTPEELKELVRRAHELGLAVIMDIVHSHFVKNLNEGINELDGTDCLYSLPGAAGDHPYWDSKVFDYGKDPVQHFLLSNIKYWLDEFHFDGFRFDGVTSMLYYHHGYTEFDDPEKFFNADVNRPALVYLTLANELVHTVKPNAITIAEDVSGMPATCFPVGDGGVGFDYRLAMAIPDFWIELLEDVPDEQWDIWRIWDMMVNRLPGVGTVTYCESHDQALVGDKTIAFRLMGAEMYTHMDRESQSLVVDRGMALHKMIRLLTIAAGGDAYLNFMGNEFGHPEWIDFPREGNDWSYAYARRQWSLADSPFLRYSFLNAFDKEMVALMKKYRALEKGYAYNLQMDPTCQTMVFHHDDLVFVFNWSPTKSMPDYTIPVPFAGRYKIVLTTDAARFGGPGRQDETVVAFSFAGDVAGMEGAREHYMKIYNTNRSATVFKRMKG